MKLNAGIITDKLEESKKFYTEVLDFGVSFENDFYLLLHTPNQQAEIGFLMPRHPSQKPIFQAPYSGAGTYFTIEVDNVDDYYKKIKAKGTPIHIDIRDEDWGDRHFAVVDPNGIGIDIKKNDQKLFKLYQRFSPDYAEGRGIGLFLVKSQVHSMKGTIDIKSKLGKGSIKNLKSFDLRFFVFNTVHLWKGSHRL